MTDAPTGSDPATFLSGPDRELLELVVHDLRTPLTSIVGFAEILAERHDEMGPTMQREALAAIRRSAAHASALLDGLAELLLPHRDATDEDAVPLDVAGLLRAPDARRRVRPEVTVREGGGPVTVRAVGSVLTALLDALVSEAVTPPGERAAVTVTGSRTEVLVTIDVGPKGGEAPGGLHTHVVDLLVARLGGHLERRAPGPGRPGAQLVCHLPATL